MKKISIAVLAALSLSVSCFANEVECPDFVKSETIEEKAKTLEQIQLLKDTLPTVYNVYSDVIMNFDSIDYIDYEFNKEFFTQPVVGTLISLKYSIEDPKIDNDTKEKFKKVYFDILKTIKPDNKKWCNDADELSKYYE